MLLPVTHQLAKFGGHRLCGRDIRFNISNDLVRPRDPLMVSHTPAMFGGHRYGSGDMVLVCHVISHHSAKFGGYRHCGSGNIMVLVSHMISQDHVIKEACDFMGRSPSR